MPEIPFFSKTAVLDTYLGSNAESLPSKVQETIAQTLRKQEDLYIYFFSHRPDPSWARILESKGYFEIAPDLVEKNGNLFAHPWPEQEFLISVASEVPDVVIKHVRKLTGHGYYHERSIKAIENVSVSTIEEMVTDLLRWLDDERIGPFIGLELLALIQVMAKKNSSDSFLLFEKLTIPRLPSSGGQPSEIYFGRLSYPLFPLDDYAQRTLRETSSSLRKLEPYRLLALLIDRLESVLVLENGISVAENFRMSSFWRSAIEDSGQDRNSEYKDQLLNEIRDTVQYISNDKLDELDDLVRGFLKSGLEVLRRLGIYFVSRYPEILSDLVKEILLNPVNLDDIGIHHEFFTLLSAGFETLNSVEQEQLVNSILLGPPKREVSEEEDRNYEKSREDVWVRDRLLMLGGSLPHESNVYLEKLLDKYGKPEHPEFTHWIGQGYFVSSVSPVTVEDLRQKTDQNLLTFLKDWRPSGNFGPTEETYGALGAEVASLIESDEKRYGAMREEIARLHSAFAVALLRFPRKDDHNFGHSLDRQLDFAERMMSLEEVRESLNESNQSWVFFRSSLVRSISAIIDDDTWSPTPLQASRLFGLLYKLAIDPDPDLESDQPSEGWLGHNDPLTVAINHVRPQAVAALIGLACHKGIFDDGGDKSGKKSRFSEEMNVFFTERVRRDRESSLSVHSVFGRELNRLYMLDNEWVEKNVNEIFPVEDDPKSIPYFVAAWDSWVINSFVYHEIFELLRSRYERSIDNLSNGHVTKTFDPGRGLASHLLMEYISAKYAITSEEGKESLIAKFFVRSLPGNRGQATWELSKRVGARPNEWPRAKELWLWRLDEAIKVKHNSDFRSEMGGFSHLLLAAPENETISSMWFLLEGFLPYLSDAEGWDRIWHNLEKYLAREVGHDSERVIRFYSLMHDYVRTPQYYYGEDATAIIEEAAKETNVRTELIALIDKLNRKGIYQFKPLQDHLLGSSIGTPGNLRTRS